MKKLIAAGIFVCLLVCSGIAGSGATVVLKNDRAVATIIPDLLEIRLQGGGNSEIEISAAQTNLGSVSQLKTTDTTATWEFNESKLRVTIKLEAAGLAVHLLAEKTGEITFPILPETQLSKGWIVPMFEGVYAPRGDERWAAFLTKQEAMNATADLTMPFLGMDYGNFTLTCIFTNAFNSTIQFQRADGNTLQARVTHQFTRNHPIKECGYFFQFGKSSPVEPARIYRDWLIQRGEFVSLAEKIKRTPEAAKLPGAAHIYLWGSDLIAPEDVLDWKQFLKEFVAQKESANKSIAQKVWSLMTPEAQKFVMDMSRTEWPDKYSKAQITGDLSRILSDTNLGSGIWPDEKLDAALHSRLKTDRSTWTKADWCHANCELLAAAFPGLLAKPEEWGNGVCPKMVTQLANAGFDRLWLGSGSWDEFVERPEIVDIAKKAGYLIGPYDSYNSIHRTNESSTWETAQFDQQLYETGGIINADGTKRRGFQKKGYLLSPDAAGPWVEKRVTRLMKTFAANSWFMDCDGFGEYYDDYSELHPATQQSDLQSRISRMAWIRDRFGAVIGSEGCSAGVASTILFAHGVMTPVIGWGDPDLTNKKSKYYLGKYYPPEQPEAFFKPVPTKEEYRYIYFDPRFRLPLFETVFHDSVVATHHWSFPSLKTADQAGTVELLELLYNVPPLYHLNIQEFKKRGAEMKRHYDFFSPLHRETALLPMTEFKWLTDDHLVQRTIFGDRVEMSANFGTEDFQSGNVTIPKRSIQVTWHDSGKSKIYKLVEKPE